MSASTPCASVIVNTLTPTTTRIIEAIAVCFLHSYANPENERKAVEIDGERAFVYYLDAAAFLRDPRAARPTDHSQGEPTVTELLDGRAVDEQRLAQNERMWRRAPSGLRRHVVLDAPNLFRGDA